MPFKPADFDICLSVARSTVQEALKAIVDRQKLISIAEIRLDYLHDCSLDSLKWLVRYSPVPLLFTNRAAWEGGQCKDDDAKRLHLLELAIEAGANFIDVELKTEPIVRQRLILLAKKKQVKVIVSHHDFQITPEMAVLEGILTQMCATEADIAKIVTTCLEPKDIRGVMSLYFHPATKKIRLCAFCMGGKGRLSRLICTALGSCLTYVSCDETAVTAPGQLSAEHFHNLYSQLA